MIVRIMGEGQFVIPDGALPALNELDSELERAVLAEDETSFRAVLSKLLAQVRSAGEPAAADDLHASELILPRADATLADVSEMLTADGLIPG
jgi:hypothetical protein